jgi:APA family basic amino acid/polyamine antiporter
VIALSALFMPHYLGAAIGVDAIQDGPWDAVVALVAIVTIAGVRLVRRPSLYALGILVPALDLLTQLVLVGLGLAMVFSPSALTHGTSLGEAPTWGSLAIALPLAMLAYTGLETVANLAEEARRPGIDLRRSLLAAIATVVALYVAIAVVALSVFPGPESDLGDEWLGAPLVGVATAIGDEMSSGLGDVLRFFVGASGALILLAAVTTSISGFTRLAYSLGEHGQLPRAFGRLHRRTLVSPQAIVSAAAIAGAIVISTAFVHDEIRFLASVFSFGVLLGFTAAQLAVIKLRLTEPDLPRPYRAAPNVTFRGKEVPVPAIVGAVLTSAVWVVALATHAGARYAGPAWLLAGIAVYVAVRRSRGEGLTERIAAPDELKPADLPHFRRILVPMKLGIIGEEMVATAVKLASEHGAKVEALYVMEVPLELPLDAALDEQEAGAEQSLSEARAIGQENGVEVTGRAVRARAIGRAIVDRAAESGVDLIVLGSSPRWRRQSRFFSPTVDFVLRHAPCEVLVVAFPQRVLDEELAAL